MKTKSIILIAISLGFGLIAALGMTHLMARSKASAVPAIEEIQVLVAKEDIKLGVEVTADMVMMKKFRPGSVPEMSATKMEEIEGMRAKDNISKGNFLPRELLIEKTKWMTTSIPKGYTVVSTKPDLVSTAHNSLNPGDRIDIIAILRHPKTGQQTAKTFLKNIMVYGVNAQTTRMHRDEPINIKIVQVLVRPRQAEQLALVESVGKLRFVRIGGEETVIDPEGMDPNSENTPTGPVSIISFFDTEDKPKAEFDAEQKRMLAELQKTKSELEAEKNKLIDKNKPFKMQIHGAGGPIEYVWTNRTAVPVAVATAGNDAMQVPEKAAPAPPAAPAPDTYAPEGEPTDGAKSAGSSGTSGSSEPSSNREQTHSY